MKLLANFTVNKYQVNRGGSRILDLSDVREAYRSRFAPDVRSYDLSFRPCRKVR